MSDVHELKTHISNHYHNKFAHAVRAMELSLRASGKFLGPAKRAFGEEKAEHAKLHHEMWAEHVKLGAEKLRDECGLDAENLYFF